LAGSTNELVWEIRSCYFSLLSTPQEGKNGKLLLCIKRSNNLLCEFIFVHCEKILSGETNNNFWFDHPRGKLLEVLEVTPDKPLLLLGGGTGAAPLVSFVRHLWESIISPPVIFVYSAKNRKELMFEEKCWEASKKNKSFTYLPVITSDGGNERDDNDRGGNDDKQYQEGRVNLEVLRRVLKLHENFGGVVISGPALFVVDMMAMCLQLGCSRDMIHVEQV